jgi:hypothetical protein
VDEGDVLLRHRFEVREAGQYIVSALLPLAVFGSGGAD